MLSHLPLLVTQQEDGLDAAMQDSKHQMDVKSFVMEKRQHQRLLATNRPKDFAKNRHSSRLQGC